MNADDQRPPPRLTSHQLRQIAVRIHRDPRSVQNAYAGRAKGIVYADVAEAAQALGLPLPPAKTAE